jgi:hypothetical protein
MILTTSSNYMIEAIAWMGHRRSTLSGRSHIGSAPGVRYAIDAGETSS